MALGGGGLSGTFSGGTRGVETEVGDKGGERGAEETRFFC